MPDSTDVDALTTQAGEAASRGDAATAAALLGRALDRQVSTLGPDHRELAPTLNNLAMMLERQGEVAEAERCYRRAYDVARRGAGVDDPMVQMSRANLVAFLQASGVAEPVVDMPAVTQDTGGDPPVPVAATPVPSPPPPRAEPPRPAPADRTAAEVVASPRAATSTSPKAPAPGATTPVAATGSPRARRFALAIAAGAVVGGLAGWLVMAPDRPAPDAEAPPASTPLPIDTTPPAARPDEPARTQSGAPAAPPAASPPRNSEPPSRSIEPAPAPARDAAQERGPAASVGGRPETASISTDGQLCTTLARGDGVWRCEPAGASIAADAIYYYARVRSTRDLVVGHRWSHQGTVVRTVTIEVRANPQDGFRTFSRQSLAGRSGAWEVALVAPDGTVVESLRFNRN